MSKWIPDWADHYSMTRVNQECVIIRFHCEGTVLTKPIEELAKELAVEDVLQQIRTSRRDVIGQNGNEGLHYKTPTVKSKYHHKIKTVDCVCGKSHPVWVDVYDVLNAFNVHCHALAHAIKKLLMPGNRGAKDYKQDCNEAIQSINRSIDERV